MSKFIKPLLVSLMAAFGSFASFPSVAQDFESLQSGDSEEGAIALSADHASAIGSVAFDRAIADLPIITHGEDFDRIQRIMTRLVRSAARPDIGWRMVLVDSDIPDAWVLPDGKMAIYVGILNRLHDDQEVAALLTHQMAHSLLGHNMFLLGRNEIQSVLMAQDTGASGSMREQLAYNLGVSIAEGVQVMPYSRMMESEADDLSMVMMLKAGYDPAAAIGTWQWLSDESRFAMEYLSSHPSVSWRIEQMSDQLPCYHKAFEETWGHKPVGLEEQYRDSTIECPPFVTGMMSNIKRDHRDENYIYDWEDEPGYEAAYYDHVRYNRFFYDDPYYNAWHLGRVSYSFGFGFGGFSYYRWSPFWSGWTYYDPWRPHYVFRIGRGHNHYVDHPYRYSRNWSRHNIRFRKRHYDRDDYHRDEDRYRERRREYKDYSHKQRATIKDGDGRHDRTLPRDNAERRKQQEAVQRAVTSNRTKVTRSGGVKREKTIERAKPQVQPKRVKSYRATSEKAAIKVPSKVRKSRERQGVMEFREQAQKQPVRAERGKNSKSKTYSTPKRQVQPKVERANKSYKPRKVNNAPTREKAQKQKNSQPKAQSQPKKQQNSKPKAQRQPKKQSYKAPKQSSQPKQNYKAPAQPKSNGSSSSNNSSSKPSRKSPKTNPRRDRN